MSNTLTPEQKLQQQRDKARLRQARFYLANKDKINEKRKQNTKLLSDLKKKHLAEQTTPTPAPTPTPTPTPIGLDQINHLLEQLKETGVIKTAGTLKKYLGDIKRLLKLTDCDDLTTCLKHPTEIIAEIDNSSFSVNTIKSLYQTIVFAIDNFKLPYSKAVFAEYKKKFDLYKVKSTDQSQEKTKETILPFPEYLERVKEKFGVDSKMYLLARLYNEITLRDNFQLLIVNSADEAVNDTTNYLILSKPTYTIELNDDKTFGKYGVIPIKLSKDVTKLIKDYMKKEKIEAGSYLFGNKKLSNYISTKNKLIGVADGINYFRHAKITEELNGKNLSAEQRLELATKMRHSVIVQLRYLRNQ